MAWTQFANALVPLCKVSESTHLILPDQLSKLNDFVATVNHLASMYKECAALGADEAQSGIVTATATLDTLQICLEFREDPDALKDIQDEIIQLEEQIIEQKGKAETLSQRFRDMRGHFLVWKDRVVELDLIVQNYLNLLNTRKKEKDRNKKNAWFQVPEYIPGFSTNTPGNNDGFNHSNRTSYGPPKPVERPKLPNNIEKLVQQLNDLRSFDRQLQQSENELIVVTGKWRTILSMITKDKELKSASEKQLADWKEVVVKRYSRHQLDVQKANDMMQALNLNTTSASLSGLVVEELD